VIVEKYFPALSHAFAAMLPLLAGRRLAVVGHARPDGDCIGSQVALARVLRALGHEVICVNTDPVPRRLQYLTGDVPFVRPHDVPANEDWVSLWVDCADNLRAGDKARERFPKPFANIDHHLSNNSYAEHNFIDSNAAAATEILAGIFADNKLPVDALAAKALFAGIMTDTGQFRFNSTTHRTFLLTAELVALGASPSEAGGEIYERESLGKLQLLQRFLASLKLDCGGLVCIGSLPDGIFQETGTSVEDTEGLVDYARAIDGVEIGVLIEERPGAIKASLRCKNPLYRVDQVAAQFGGGGHACAAGLNLKNIPVAEFRPQLLGALAAQIARVSNTAESAS
jgi:bifunctional oligoribonuclease and PAP phosphatase NrnA